MRKLLLIGTMGALLALLVSACGGSSGGGGTISVAKEGESPKTANAACEEEPVAGGSLVYSRQLETVTLNPREIKNGNGDIFAQEMIFSGIVRNDPNGTDKVVPGLAESWDISKDGLTYTFHLRPGLKYSDGSPLSAEDIAWNLEQFADPEVNISLAGVAAGMESVKATNAKTVVVKLEHPVAAFLYNLAIFPAFIVDKAKLEAEGAAYWKHPVGTGPFMVKEFANGSHITFEKNPYYFEKGKPYLQTMRWNFVPNSNTRVLALKSGEAQLADGIPFAQVESLQGESNLGIQEVELPQAVILIANNRIKPLGDVHVRRALSLAINREQLNEAVFRGTGTVPNSVLMNFELDASDQEVPPFEYDVAKAKEEMAASKFPKGFSVKLQYPAGSDYFKQMSLLIQSELKEIGVDLKLEELESAAVAEKWFGGEFEMTFPFVGTSSDVPVPDEYASFYALPAAELNGFKSYWTNKEAEGLVEKFISSTNEAGRKAEWKKIQELFNEEMPSLNVMDFPLINGHQSNICGTKANGLGVDQLQETWIAEKSS
ncbi:MAG TPA: ABC transporter substrate-binding protein [Solirubrobacterales bacterium]|nr:ABC transporter substrate-binding protein [Solirubrobacterales bacterium]